MPDLLSNLTTKWTMKKNTWSGEQTIHRYNGNQCPLLTWRCFTLMISSLKSWCVFWEKFDQQNEGSGANKIRNRASCL